MLVNGWIGHDVVEPSLGYLGTLCLRVSFGVLLSLRHWAGAFKDDTYELMGRGGHGVIDVGCRIPVNVRDFETPATYWR